MPHIDPELRYERLSPTMRDQMRRSADPERARQLDLEGLRDSSARELKRVEGLLDTVEDEDHESLLNIEHRYHHDRLKFAEMRLARRK